MTDYMDRMYNANTYWNDFGPLDEETMMLCWYKYGPYRYPNEHMFKRAVVNMLEREVVMLLPEDDIERLYIPKDRITVWSQPVKDKAYISILPVPEIADRGYGVINNISYDTLCTLPLLRNDPLLKWMSDNEYLKEAETVFFAS